MSRKADKPISASPLLPDDAIQAALRTPLPPKERRGVYDARPRRYRSKEKPGLLEVFRNGDGTFDVSYGWKQVGVAVTEKQLEFELCRHYGFCGGEYEGILQELEKSNRFIRQL